MFKFSYDSRGINDANAEYKPRIATFSQEYLGRHDIGILLEASPILLDACRKSLSVLETYRDELLIQVEQDPTDSNTIDLDSCQEAINTIRIAIETAIHGGF